MYIRPRHIIRALMLPPQRPKCVSKHPQNELVSQLEPETLLQTRLDDLPHLFLLTSPSFGSERDIRSNAFSPVMSLMSCESTIYSMPYTCSATYFPTPHDHRHDLSLNDIIRQHPTNLLRPNVPLTLVNHKCPSHQRNPLQQRTAVHSVSDRLAAVRLGGP